MRRHRPFGPVAPEAPFAAIGDIHGRADLLARLLAQLDPDLPLVCVGDYIDRGEHSAEVLRMLQNRPDVTCLKGNHEAMMEGFLANPEQNGPRWLRNGGLQTLASFGVAGVTDTARKAELRAAQAQLSEALGAQGISWLATLPSYWQTGNVAVTHAGADPDLPLGLQPLDVLHWGHPGFLTVPRGDGIWVVHGHTIVEEPSADDGRIAVDTGAYATGRLTAALIAPGRVEFVST